MDNWSVMLIDASKMFLFLALELSVLFLIISAGVSWLRQRIPDEKIQKMLGGRRGKGYAIAAALGSLTPFCSCSTIPMLRGLLSARAGFGPTLTFLFVSPLLNPIIVGLMWATFGWKVTVLYTVIAAGVSVIASFLLDKWGFERYVIEASGGNGTCATACSSSAGAAAVSQKTACCSETHPLFPLCRPLRAALLPSLRLKRLAAQKTVQLIPWPPAHRPGYASLAWRPGSSSRMFCPIWYWAF